MLQEQASEQAISTSSLALAMLSSFSRVPELASCQDVLDKVPLLVKVCSAAPLLTYSSPLLTNFPSKQWIIPTGYAAW